MKRLIFLLALFMVSLKSSKVGEFALHNPTANPTTEDVTKAYGNVERIINEVESGLYHDHYDSQVYWKENLLDVVGGDYTFSDSQFSMYRYLEYSHLNWIHFGDEKAFYNGLYEAYYLDRLKLKESYPSLEITPKSEWDKLSNEGKHNLYFGVYYVTTTGSNSNSGTSEGNAWATINHAFDTMVAGDIAYVKAGNYGAAINYTERAGTSANPITIEGYLTTAGDISSSNGPTYTYADLIADGKELDGLDMPFLDNNTLDPDESDRAFNFDHSYITVRNFKIQEMEYGGDVDVNITGIIVDNVICNRMGNWDPSNPGWNLPYSETEPNGNLNGNGFRFKDCNDCAIRNSLVVNAGHVGIKLNSCDGGLYENNYIYSADTGNATDYKFLVYNSSNVTIRNLTSLREDLDPTLMHQGRSFAIQCDSYGVLLEGATLTNSRFMCWQGPNNNVFRNITMTGNDTNTGGAFMLGDAVHDNVFYNTYSKDALGPDFYGTIGVQCGYDGTETAGNENYFVNPIVDSPPGAEGFITFDDYDSRNTATVGTTWILGGTFYDSDYAISSRRNNTSMVIANSTFNDVSTSWAYSPEGITNNITYVNCHANGTPTPPSGFTESGDPLFTDPNNGDFTLQSGSPLIGAGVDATTYLAGANIDFNNNTRTTPYDIGAYADGSTGGGGATCSDGIQNGNETGVDCGGSCSSCDPGTPAPTNREKQLRQVNALLTNN